MNTRRFMRRLRRFFHCARWDEPKWLDEWERTVRRVKETTYERRA